MACAAGRRAALLLCAAFGLGWGSDAMELGQALPSDGVQQIVDKAYEAADTASAAADQAADSAAEAESLGQQVPGLSEKAEPAEKAVEKSLADAEAAEKSAEELTKGVEEEAYTAAKAAAEREVSRIQGEADAYFAAYSADIKLARVPALDTVAQSAAVTAAAAPYLAAEQKVEATVESYNSLAINIANEAVMYTDKAKQLADMAVSEQSLGSTVLAAKHMMEAHKLLYLAKEKKARATQVRELAERINNDAVPSYKQAAEQAGDHAMAAFSGLQLSQRPGGRLRRSAAADA